MAEKVMSNLQEELLREKAEARRPWRWMAGIFGVLFLILGVLIFKDIPPPDDVWMLPQFTPGGGPKNDLVIFTENVQKLASIDVKLPAREVLNVDVDKMEEARQCLAENAAHLALYDELMKTQTSEWRWPDDHEVLYSKQHAYYLRVHSKTSRLASMRTKLLAREGKSEEAQEESLKSICFAHGLSKAEGILINWLVAETNHRLALDTLVQVITWGDVDESHLRRIQDSLALLFLSEDDYLFSLKAEYLYQKDFIVNLKMREAALAERAIELPWWMKTFYQPNRCLEWVLQSQKPIVQALSRNWADAFIAISEADVLRNQQARQLRYLFSPNAGGNYIMFRQIGFEVFGGKTIPNVALFRQTLIVIAMRRFELAQGRLPTYLEELVPQYLAEVPVDPFDNKPMRWNVQTNVVYSVGRDLRDDAGKASRPWKSSDADVGVHYFWKPEKVEKK